jgi:protocatechuate 3,4-dioxygenase beta subunit
LEPTGKLKWATFGDQYLTGPMGETSNGATLIPTFEKFVISGRVTDAQGAPVFGAAVKVGKALLFSDSDGLFEVRVKNRPLPVTVDVQDFSAPGQWKVVTCPSSATPGESILITVAKL